MQTTNQKDDPESQALYEKALKYAKLYAKDCEDLTREELSDAVFEHLTLGRKSFVPNVENVVKGAVQYVFKRMTNGDMPETQGVENFKPSTPRQEKEAVSESADKRPKIIKLPRRRGR